MIIDAAKIVNCCQCNCFVEILSRSIFALMLISDSHGRVRRLKFLGVVRHTRKQTRNISKTADKTIGPSLSFVVDKLTRKSSSIGRYQLEVFHVQDHHHHHHHHKTLPVYSNSLVITRLIKIHFSIFLFTLRSQNASFCEAILPKFLTHIYFFFYSSRPFC
jgi:hypothetical protein